MKTSRHQLAGYPAPWHSDVCLCPICRKLRDEERLERIARALERIADREEGDKP